MSQTDTGLVLGYHGCDRDVGLKAVKGNTSLLASDKAYDWLGPGMYFWEGDPVRAAGWAESKAKLDASMRPFVVGAVIQLGNCLDLTLRENLDLLSVAYNSLAASAQAAKKPLPVNKDPKGVGVGDKLMRFLDCAVIRRLHTILEGKDGATSAMNLPSSFDTVRGLFPEGPPVYDGGGFLSLTHTQIAVRNDACIRGFFIPRL